MSITMWIGFSPPSTETLAQPEITRSPRRQPSSVLCISLPLQNFLDAQSNRQRLIDRSNVKLQVIRPSRCHATSPGETDIGAQAILAISQVGAKRLELKIRQRFRQILSQLTRREP